MPFPRQPSPSGYTKQEYRGLVIFTQYGQLWQATFALRLPAKLASVLSSLYLHSTSPSAPFCFCHIFLSQVLSLNKYPAPQYLLSENPTCNKVCVYVCVTILYKVVNEDIFKIKWDLSIWAETWKMSGSKSYRSEDRTFQAEGRVSAKALRQGACLVDVRNHTGP